MPKFNGVKKGIRKAVSKMSGFHSKALQISTIDVPSTFSSFAPNSAGSYKMRSALTISTINSFIQSFSDFSKSINLDEKDVINSKDFNALFNGAVAAKELEKLFNFHGSDKSRDHDYHLVYGAILQDRDAHSIVEIGLGTNNEDTASNMGSFGKPGASLRAFRDFEPQAFVVGADIDKRVLFEEERIKTFFVDQTDPETLKNLQTKISFPPNLIIDDGLHSPDANLNTLKFGLEIIAKDGWVVIEDIPRNLENLWKIVALFLPKSEYNAYLINAKSSMVFAVNKI